MNTIRIEGTDLASRAHASRLRNELIHALNSNLDKSAPIVLDFSGVESISDSFADELFGVLSASLGIEEFFNKIKVIRIKTHLRKVIAINVNIRSGHQIAA